MKTKADLPLLATLAGGILFNYLFWAEKQALNLLIYSLFVLVLLFWDKEILKSKKLIVISASHLLAAMLVVINHSALSVITWYISFIVCIGFAHFQQLRSVYTAILAASLQFLTAPISLIKRIANAKLGNISLKPEFKLFKYVLIPLIVILIFCALYSTANKVFAKYLEIFSNSILSYLNSLIIFFFADLNLPRILHLFLGITFTAAVVFKFSSNIEKNELEQHEQMLRRRKKRDSLSVGQEFIAIFAGNLYQRKMALKTENIIGILSFSALNLLLLFLNSIDISTLWLAKADSLTSTNYSAELHEGTNALIFSILMAMMVILYFFSGNLNFYSKNKTIRLLSYIWIIQNGFLVLSVLHRDYNYISMYGLTYKRIGVLVFLLLCSIGLATVYLKVARQKTFFYLCKVNGAIWYILLLVLGLVNWDVFIVNYNIRNESSIRLDLDHLTDMSDKTLPLLIKNKEMLKSYLPLKRYRYLSNIVVDTSTTVLSKQQAQDLEQQGQITAFEDELSARRESFEHNYAQTSWLSWNYPDWQTHQFFQKKE
ncbi:DUF4173 domain-containing protein [Pedobacter sp. MC2016-14]|uniref:DUF4153 domain-containing protein n=1 Tax=Pedobacter sp. MC2016-14 TaxID=2897327 RepID=UPI001E413B48|nr:DUF4173 domain-containing protein [Pedobacter sp. MC2016-14]MCD0488853.1 DUF4173 domain-containing protein [Pedobacter sp. MC2016-14]